jgi:hypothetical protein
MGIKPHFKASGITGVMNYIFMMTETTPQDSNQSGTPPWSRFRMKPKFIIIGAQKAGTTSLYHLLCQHPRVKPARKKELHYFDTNYHRGQRWYEAMFPFAVPFLNHRFGGLKKITGEASPYYMFHPRAISRLARTLPDAKLIVLLRNPVERAYSHYHHETKNKNEILSFEEALAKEKDRVRSEAEKLLQDRQYRSLKHRRFSYLSRGIYADQLEVVFRFFARKQVLILKSRDYLTNPEQVLRQACSFLGIPEWQPKAFPRLNEGHYAGMREDTKRFLENYFRDHNQRLYQFVGRDFGW